MTGCPTRRLKFVCEGPLKYGANAAAEFDNSKWPRFVRITDIADSGQLKDDTFRSLPPQIAEEFLLEDGDILLARSGSVGRSFIYKREWGEACFAGYLVRARLSKEFCPRFVYWSLNSSEYWAWIESMAIRSTIQNVSAERYAEFVVPAPPLATQQRIARFLDEKTARIDGLIEKKRELLDRLAEKRQALITHVVTKGLDPSARAKTFRSDTRRRDRQFVEGAGMKTAYGSLRYFSRIKNGTTPASGEPDYWNGDVLWATPEDLGKLTGDHISQTKRKVTEKAVVECNLSVLPVGSVIISTRAPIGHMAINETPMALNQGCRGIIPGDQVDGLFLYYLLKSRTPEFNAMANGTTFVELSREELAAVTVQLPPLETQRRIARFLDKKTARIDGLVEKILDSIERLEEYRSAQITAAVTGQLEDIQ